MFHFEGVIACAAPVLLSPFLFMEPPKQFHCLFVVALVAIYWVTEALPLFVTSLIPIVAYPIAGVLKGNEVADAFFNTTIIETFCGLLLGTAIEVCNLHRRIALGTILVFGCSPRKLQFGVIISAMFLSMWISNSVCVATLCPIVKMVFDALNEKGMVEIYSNRIPKSEYRRPDPSSTMICYYLSITYASTIGGCGTMIGTGSNLVIKGLFETRFPLSGVIDYVSFMIFSSPIMLVQTLLLYLWLQIVHLGWLRPKSKAAQAINVGKEGEQISRQLISEKYKELGSLTLFEAQVMFIFVLMNVTMFTFRPLQTRGWADIWNLKSTTTSAPFMFTMLLFLVLPVNYGFMWYLIGKRPENEGTARTLLTWKDVHENVQWGRLLLLGGGFVLAKGVKDSGLSDLIGHFLDFLQNFPPPFLQLCFIIAGVVMTAFSSNIAVCNILIAVMAEVSYVIRKHPLYLTVPTGLACGLAFHLPGSTPANAIVADYANISSKDMAIAGIGPTLITVSVLFAASQSWVYIVYPTIYNIPVWFDD